MNDFQTLIDDYMVFRAARGFQPNPKTRRLLRQFVDTLPSHHDNNSLFSNADILRWVQTPENGAASWLSYRLSAVRGFAQYLAGSGLEVTIPPYRQIPAVSHRATPYIYSDAEIQAIMNVTHQLFTQLRAATMTTLVGLLSVTGIRIGEALQIRIRDLDQSQQALTITNAKYGRQRLVYLDSSSCAALQTYLDFARRRRLGVAEDRPIFVTTRGTAISHSNVSGAFHQMIQHAGLGPRAGARPRLHDLRHTFATKTMIDTYRRGKDPAQTLVALSIWLGHSNPADTYWYLQATPEIAAVAATRLEESQEL